MAEEIIQNVKAAVLEVRPHASLLRQARSLIGK